MHRRTFLTSILSMGVLAACSERTSNLNKEPWTTGSRFQDEQNRSSGDSKMLRERLASVQQDR